MTFPFPITGQFAGGSGLSFSFIDYSTSTGSSVTLISDIEAGDLLIYSDIATDGSSAPASVTPSGFTNIINEFFDVSPYGGYRAMVSWKLAVGTEGGTSVTGMNGSIRDSKICAVWRGGFSALTANDVVGDLDFSNPSAQTITSGSGTSPLVAIGIYAEFLGAAVSPRDFTPAADGELNQSTAHYLKYRIYNSNPDTKHTQHMDDEGINFLASFYMEGS